MGKENHPLIEKLQLQPHPEGGFFKQVFQSQHRVHSPVHNMSRPAVTHIYFLLLKGQVSRFHRVLHDEIWNHYDGAPLRLYHIHQQQLREQRLGGSEYDFVAVIPAGDFQAAETTGDYSLLGCTVSPGFDFADFSFIEEPSMKQWIEVAHPDMSRFV
ncbi:cupin domain-containing protein [Aestuariibacter sp. A3R04]|uniref:cupin domain-containing protein n=1 Tax=Aestuariibacter sp. A3R04 TaxID=2841571 RepID=UPI001C0A1B56|nr:cupin domain-containing protein [Aestuariibacter sp. A3R04]MBU3020732.1 cupin domain-containing protein [Aestuariibacter sp. A3R04]